MRFCTTDDEFSGMAKDAKDRMDPFVLALGEASNTDGLKHDWMKRN